MLVIDLTAYLKADAAITAAVGGRVFPNIIPQGSTFPAISYNQVSGLREYDVNDGPTGRAMPRITINAWATRYLDVRNLAEAIRLRLNGFRGMMGSTRVGRITLDNEFDTFEEEAGQSGIHRVTQDYIISFVEGA